MTTTRWTRTPARVPQRPRAKAWLAAVLAAVVASALLTLVLPAKAAVVSATPGGTASASTAQASVTTHGYLKAPDGASLNYTVVLPNAQGRFPVALAYDGYSAGYAPMTDNGDAPITNQLLARGLR